MKNNLVGLTFNKYVTFTCVNLTVLINTLSGGDTWKETKVDVLRRILSQNELMWTFNFGEIISIALSFCFLTWLILEQLEIYLIIKKRTSMKRTTITEKINPDKNKIVKEVLFDYRLNKII